MRKLIPLMAVLVIAVAALAAAGSAFAGSSGDGSQDNPFGPGDKVAICHYDGSSNGHGGSGKYNMPNPSVTATGPAGHIGHDFDVIPSYWFQQNANQDPVFYAGVNWPTLTNLPSSPVDFTSLEGTSAQAFIDSGCAAPAQPPTEVTPVAPTVSNPNCDHGSVVTVPQQPEGVLVDDQTVDGVETVTFSAADGFVLADGVQTVYHFTLDAQLTGDQCNSGGGGGGGGNPPPPVTPPVTPPTTGGGTFVTQQAVTL